MSLTREQLEQITYGHIGIVEKEDGWFGFKHFTEYQAEKISSYMASRRAQTQVSAGLELEVEGDIRAIRFEFRLESALRYVSYSIDVLENGIHVFSKKGSTNDTVCGVLEYKPENEKNCNIRVWFPWGKVAFIRNVEIEGDWHPVERKTKLLVYGDSITHGSVCTRPSLMYAARLADAMKANALNLAIGGNRFHADELDENCPFKPDVITVAYGTNDWSGLDDPITPADEYFARLREIYPKIPIVGFLPIYRHITEEKMATKQITLEEAREGYRKVMEKYDVIPVNARDFIPHEIDYYTDGLHPNDLGNAMMGPNFVAAVKAVLPEFFES